MNHNFTLAILVKKGVLTLDEAKHLAEEVRFKIHSQEFSDAYRVVDEIFKKLESRSKKLLDF